MPFKRVNRQLLAAAIVIFYLIPLLFFSIYGITLMSHHKSWLLLSLGLLLIACGTLSLMILLFYWEQSVLGSHSLSLSSENVLENEEEKEAKVTLLKPSLIASKSIGTQGETELFHPLPGPPKGKSDTQGGTADNLEPPLSPLQKLEEENERLELKIRQANQDFADYKLFSEEQLKQKQLQISTLQHMMEDQRAEMERRQEQIYQLDAKIHDLSGEIKTLLYLHEEQTSAAVSTGREKAICPSSLAFAHTGTQSIATELPSENEGLMADGDFRTPAEAMNLLKKCLDTTQQLTGAYYCANEASRYREFSSSYYAMDRRRLFETLRGETRAMLIVYSQKERRLLFVNNASKSILGWTPKKFIAEFSSIMQVGMSEWTKALHTLNTAPEAQARLLAKTRDGQELLLYCHLGVVSSGLFRHHIMGVLYPIT